MVDKYQFSVIDYDGERSGGSLSIVNLTGANFDTQAGLANDFRTALNGIMLSTVSNDSMRNIITDADSQPSNSFAQRETKWLATAEDVITGRLYNYEYPTADLGLLENNSPYIVNNGVPSVVTGVVAVQAFIDAFEALAVSPDGNPLSLRVVQQVGRNL
jgi:hypothetical protein